MRNSYGEGFELKKNVSRGFPRHTRGGYRASLSGLIFSREWLIKVQDNGAGTSRAYWDTIHGRVERHTSESGRYSFTSALPTVFSFQWQILLSFSSDAHSCMAVSESGIRL
jgi:hypothetical protein